MQRSMVLRYYWPFILKLLRRRVCFFVPYGSRMKSFMDTAIGRKIKSDCAAMSNSWGLGIFFLYILNFDYSFICLDCVYLIWYADDMKNNSVDTPTNNSGIGESVVSALGEEAVALALKRGAEKSKKKAEQENLKEAGRSYRMNLANKKKTKRSSGSFTVVPSPSKTPPKAQSDTAGIRGSLIKVTPIKSPCAAGPSSIAGARRSLLVELSPPSKSSSKATSHTADSSDEEDQHGLGQHLMFAKNVETMISSNEEVSFN